MDMNIIIGVYLFGFGFGMLATVLAALVTPILFVFELIVAGVIVSIGAGLMLKGKDKKRRR